MRAGRRASMLTRMDSVCRGRATQAALAAAFGALAACAVIGCGDGHQFIDVGAGLPGNAWCSLAWGDHDNDGDLDLVLAGSSLTLGRASSLYRNDGGGRFVRIDAGLSGVSSCSLAWGDYDSDGDLDLAADYQLQRSRLVGARR